jgi:diguanylate cyclase (GGDEF)-like protein
VLATERERLMYLVSIVFCLTLVPFGVISFVNDRFGIVVAIGAIIATCGIDAAAIRYRRPPPIPFSLLVVPMAIGISVSMKNLGIIGALWCYPAVLFFYFILSRAIANVISIALLVYSTYMVLEYVGGAVTLRFAVTLGLTIVVINIVLSIIGKLQARLVAQATTDPLTGAFNRRQMNATLALALERYSRTQSPATLLILDIDNFKRINDQLGHEAGDTVLRNVASTVQNRARKLDVLFRMGGEEFMLLLPDTSEADAMTVAEHLRGSVDQITVIEGWQLSVSIGVAQLNGLDSVDSWIKRADDALYAAKRAGRNRVMTAV